MTNASAALPGFGPRLHEIHVAHSGTLGASDSVIGLVQPPNERWPTLLLLFETGADAGRRPVYHAGLFSCRY